MEKAEDNVVSFPKLSSLNLKKMAYLFDSFSFLLWNESDLIWWLWFYILTWPDKMWATACQPSNLGEVFLVYGPCKVGALWGPHLSAHLGLGLGPLLHLSLHFHICICWNNPIEEILSGVFEVLMIPAQILDGVNNKIEETSFSSSANFKATLAWELSQFLGSNGIKGLWAVKKVFRTELSSDSSSGLTAN